LDQNPNSPTDAPAEIMIDGVDAANILAQEGELARVSGMWSGYFTGSDRQYVSLGNYQTISGDWDNAWNLIYVNIINQSRIIQGKAAGLNSKLVGVAQIMEAHAMGTLTDIWGDVPNVQAGNITEYPTPAYDSQVSIYAAVQTLLDDAIANINAGASNANDYGALSTHNDWVEIAHTLKARFYLHAKDYVNAANEAALGISSMANNWIATHPATAVESTNIYAQFNGNRGGYMTAENAHLANLIDPASTSYRGILDTKSNESARFAFYYSGTAPAYDLNYDATGFFAEDASFPLVTFEENKLILAEALIRQGGTVNLLAALTAGNELRHELDVKYGSGDDSTYQPYTANDFLPGGIFNVGGTGVPEELALKQILTEKYICMFAQIEGWSDVRRTNNALGVPANNGTQIPERLYYPQSEINSNPNTPSPIPGLFDPTPVNL